MNLSIVILAAGKGSRMKSNLAKVLHKISGKEMLYFIIKESLKVSDDVTVVIHHQKEFVQESMMKYFKNINFLVQDADNFPGTGGAVMGIKPKYEKVLILNGDMPLIKADSLEKFKEEHAEIVISIFDLLDPCGYGRVVTSNSTVERIVEEKDATKEELAITNVNAGVYLFSKRILEKYSPKLTNKNAQNEYYITDIIALAKNDNINISTLLVDENEFKGVNSKLDLAKSEEIMQKEIKAQLMEDGISMQLPETIYIEEGVTFTGESTLENGVRICGETLIHNSHIKSGSIIENSIIKDSSIGPLAHIRPLSHIQDSHIGNFVEVKKSTLKGVKAGHLTYLGDSQIDEGTNVGAGVITCNYDGKNKHQTIIGKNVFIGSDTQLIAPVIIEDDVLIGAGTTIAANKVTKGSLALSRTPLKLVENFYCKFFHKK